MPCFSEGKITSGSCEIGRMGIEVGMGLGMAAHRYLTADDRMFS